MKTARSFPSIREALEGIGSDQAKNLAKEYFAESDDFPGTHGFTGAEFEALGADQNLRNTITPADLLAVQTLSVEVPARAAIAILGDSASTISELLQKIPENVPLGSLTSREAFDDNLGQHSAAQRLWDFLRRNGEDHRWGIGPTTASKIMARKRPHLFPIEDSVVNQVIQKGRQDSWRLWWEALSDNAALEKFASDVRTHVGHTELSTLRTLDIVLWMWGRQH